MGGNDDGTKKQNRKNAMAAHSFGNSGCLCYWFADRMHDCSTEMLRPVVEKHIALEQKDSRLLFQMPIGMKHFAPDSDGMKCTCCKVHSRS